MKYLIITLFFCIFANAQVEYDVYRFPSVTPEFIVRDNYVYSVDNFNIASDQPIYKIEENRIFKVDSFGIIDYTKPIIIERWDTQNYRTEKNLRMNDSEQLLMRYLMQRGNSQTEIFRRRDF